MNNWKDLEDELRDLRPARATDSEKCEILSGVKIVSKNYGVYWRSVAAIVVIATSILVVMSLNINDEKEDQDIVDIQQNMNDSLGGRLIQTATRETTYYYIKESNNEDIFYIKGKPFRKMRYLVVNKDSGEIDGNTVEIMEPKHEEYLVPVTVY